MVKKIPILFLCLVTIACTLTIPEAQSFEDKVATQAAVALTATALDKYFNSQTATPEPTAATEVVLTATFSPIPTLNNDDPVKSLGQPNWKDDLTKAGNWFSNGSYSSGSTEFYPSGGGIIASSAKTSDGRRWYLYYEKKPKNIYIEAKFDISACSGKDQYGIAFRAPNMDDNITYLFGVTCDGSFSLSEANPSISVLLENTTSGDIINTGSNKTNILGVWAKDDRIRLYANSHFLQEISNSSLLNDGHFGLFINARETPGLTVKLDEISYWVIN